MPRKRLEATTETNARSESTTFEWKRVRMRRPPEGEKRRAQRVRSRYTLTRRNWLEPLTVVVRYSGGPEGWIVVKTRGAEWRYPGYVTLLEVLADVNAR